MISDAVFHERGQLFDPAAEHLLEALGDVHLPGPVQTDVLHAVSVVVAADLRAGAVIHQDGQAFGDGKVFPATFHEVLRDNFCNSKGFFPKEQFFSFDGEEITDRMRKPFADRGSNAMNRWFETLQQTLEREKIPEDPKKAPLVPLQVYAESLGELREAFSRWFQTCLPANARIRVFVDGVEKKCAEGPAMQIDKEFRALLSEAGLPCRWTDLSAELSVPPLDIHASHACLERM